MKKLSDMQKECEGWLDLKRVGKNDKIELFKAIRYGYLNNESLLKMNSNPIFELAKNFIIEGLSVLLDPQYASKHKNI